MPDEWNIRPRAMRCGMCEKSFDDKENCVSALRREGKNYIRLDFCANCWSQETRPEPFLSVWQGVFRAPPDSSSSKGHIRRETAESLMRRLLAANLPEDAGVIYVLAVMLERKRLLVEREVQDHAIKLRLYEHRASGELFLVPDPGLRLDELDAVQSRVIELLESTHESQ